jgi:hypothetical protein
MKTNLIKYKNKYKTIRSFSFLVILSIHMHGWDVTPVAEDLLELRYYFQNIVELYHAMDYRKLIIIIYYCYYNKYNIDINFIIIILLLILFIT